MYILAATKIRSRHDLNGSSEFSFKIAFSKQAAQVKCTWPGERLRESVATLFLIIFTAYKSIHFLKASESGDIQQVVAKKDSHTPKQHYLTS